MSPDSHPGHPGFRLCRLARLDHLADACALGSLVLAGTTAGQLLCGPAGAAVHNPVLTDERLSSLLTWAPIAIAIGLLLAVCWCERTQPWPIDEDPEGFADPAGPERRRRDADRG